jgi:polysaccharide deacetylase family protein (PEP-CTERM system associated)
MTVDLEDWFHICGVQDLLPRREWHHLEERVQSAADRILSRFEHAGLRATFFVLGYVAERHPDLVRRIARAGHEIASHGYWHRRIYTMTPEAFREDLRKSREVLEDATGSPVRGFRAPEWSIRDDSLWALDLLAEEGFAYDSSMAPLPVIGNPQYPQTAHTMERAGRILWEFPPLVLASPVINLPAGGGWGLRFFPYTLIQRAIQRHNKNGRPAMIYLHPREFDPRTPAIPLPFLKKLVLSARWETTEKRLDRLLKDFSFGPIWDAVKGVKNPAPEDPAWVAPSRDLS